MRLYRSISAGPRRGVEQACISIAKFVTEIVNERAYPDSARVHSGFEAIFPTLRYLLTTRKFAEPAISVRMPELVVRISVSYDVDAQDNLEVPNLTLLEKLTESATIEISLHSADEVPETLRVLLDRASGKHVRFTVAADTPAESGELDDSPVADRMPDADHVSDEATSDTDIVDAKIVPVEEDAVSGAPVTGDH